MNLGQIEDKTKVMKRKTAKRIFAVAAVGAVAIASVFSLTLLFDGKGDSAPVQVASATVKPQADEVSGNNAQVANDEYEYHSTKSVNGEAEVVNEKTEAMKMAMPLSGGTVLKGYSAEGLVYSKTLNHWSTHEGIDFSADAGATVFSALDGTVEAIDEDELMGTTVIIKHDNNYKTVYSSLEGVSKGINEGTRVMKGQAIGTAGTSACAEAQDGAHLHFEVSLNGKSVNPQEYLSTLMK